MNQNEWGETWQRLKGRFPNWQPTSVEAEDWCMGLRVYPAKMVEDVSRWVKTKYSSNLPAMKWFIVECEKRKNQELASRRIQKEIQVDHREDYKAERELTIQRLENTDIAELRSACRKVIDKFPFVAKPTSGDPREWKNTLRSMVFIEIYGDEAK